MGEERTAIAGAGGPRDPWVSGALRSRAPEDPEAYESLASVHEKRGDRERALEALSRGIAKLAGEPRLREVTARLLVEAGRAGEAREEGRKALELHRSRAGKEDAPPADLDRSARALLSIQPADLRDPREALGLAEKAVERSGGEEASFLETSALARSASGDREGALGALEKAASIARKEPGKWPGLLEKIEERRREIQAGGDSRP